MTGKNPGSSEQQERLELDQDVEPNGLDSRDWEREDPDTRSASRQPTQLRPVEGDGPPIDTEADEVGEAGGAGPAVGPEQAALRVEGEDG
jgi:hypothetical protein